VSNIYEIIHKKNKAIKVLGNYKILPSEQKDVSRYKKVFTHIFFNYKELGFE